MDRPTPNAGDRHQTIPFDAHRVALVSSLYFCAVMAPFFAYLWAAHAALVWRWEERPILVSSAAIAFGPPVLSALAAIRYRRSREFW